MPLTDEQARFLSAHVAGRTTLLNAATFPAPEQTFIPATWGSHGSDTSALQSRCKRGDCLMVVHGGKEDLVFGAATKLPHPPYASHSNGIYDPDAFLFRLNKSGGEFSPVACLPKGPGTNTTPDCNGDFLNTFLTRRTSSAIEMSLNRGCAGYRIADENGNPLSFVDEMVGPNWFYPNYQTVNAVEIYSLSSIVRQPDPPVPPATLSPAEYNQLARFAGRQTILTDFPAPLYQASHHGWSVEAFHQCVDLQGPLLIIGWTDSGAVVGGGTSQSWFSGLGAWVDDPGAYLFHLRGISNRAIRSKCAQHRPGGSSFFASTTSGPHFGRGDLVFDLPARKARTTKVPKSYQRAVSGGFFNHTPCEYLVEVIVYSSLDLQLGLGWRQTVARPLGHGLSHTPATRTSLFERLNKLGDNFVQTTGRPVRVLLCSLGAAEGKSKLFNTFDAIYQVGAVQDQATCQEGWCERFPPQPLPTTQGRVSRLHNGPGPSALRMEPLSAFLAVGDGWDAACDIPLPLAETDVVVFVIGGRDMEHPDERAAFLGDLAKCKPVLDRLQQASGRNEMRVLAPLSKTDVVDVGLAGDAAADVFGSDRVSRACATLVQETGMPAQDVFAVRVYDRDRSTSQLKEISALLLLTHVVTAALDLVRAS